MKLSCVVLVVLSCWSAMAKEVDEQKFLDEVLEIQRNGDDANALHMISSRIRKKNWQLYFLYEIRAESYIELGEFKKACDDYIKALPRSQKGVVEWKLGTTYEKLGEPKKAIFYLDKSIELAGEGALQNAFARYYKGRALASLGRFSKSKATLLEIKLNESSKAIMGEAQSLIDLCDEKEKLWTAMMEEHDDPEGYYTFGRLYTRQGNDEDAVKWYLRSAKGGYAKAQNKLAFCYRDGKGVEKNLVEAYAWALCAAKNGDPEAKDAMEDNMTLKQVAAAKIRLEELFEPTQKGSVPNGT